MATRSSQDVVEAVFSYGSAAARVSQDVVEVVYALISRSPTTITGAGVSQDVIEVVYALDTTDVRVSQDVIEIVYGDTSATGSGGVIGPQSTKSYAYAV